MQALFIRSARRHIHSILQGNSPHSPLPRPAVEDPTSFMNSINGHLQQMSPESLCLNHWPYLLLLSLLKHPYWRRHCRFGARIPCHTLALPLVLVSSIFDGFLPYSTPHYRLWPNCQPTPWILRGLWFTGSLRPPFHKMK